MVDVSGPNVTEMSNCIVRKVLKELKLVLGDSASG